MKKIFGFLFVMMCFVTVVSAQTTTDEQLAAQYFQNGEFDKAADAYEKLFDNTFNQYYYNNLLQSLISAKDYKRAEKILKKIIKKNPNELKYNVDLGFVYNTSGDNNKAIKQFQEAIDNLTANPQQIYDLANAFTMRMQYDYATDVYLKGRKVMKTPTSFAVELAMMYELRGKYQEMIDEYLTLAETDANYIPVVQARLQAVLNNDKENKKSQVLKTSLLRKSQKNPEVKIYSDLLMWYSLQTKDFELAFSQAKSIDRRYKDNGAKVYELTELCMSNTEYDIAIEAYRYLITKGEEGPYFLLSKVGLLNAKYLKVTSSIVYSKNDLTELEKEYTTFLTESGKNANTILLMKNLSHIYAFYSKEIEKAVTLLNEAIVLPGADKNILAECKLELADILLFSGEVWDATLLYSQVEKSFKNDPVGYMAKFKNAKLSFYIGEFDWAKAQLDVLKAATSKLIANDAMELSLLISDNIAEDSSTVALGYYAKADLLVYRNQYEEALITLDSTRLVGLTHPIFNVVLYKKAEIKIMQGLYKDADSLLQKYTDMYPNELLADDALFLQAQLNEVHLNDKVKAMILYQELIFKHPGSIYVVEARKHFRKLRGDQIN